MKKYGKNLNIFINRCQLYYWGIDGGNYVICAKMPDGKPMYALDSNKDRAIEKAKTYCYNYGGVDRLTNNRRGSAIALSLNLMELNYLLTVLPSSTPVMLMKKLMRTKEKSIKKQNDLFKLKGERLCGKAQKKLN